MTTKGGVKRLAYRVKELRLKQKMSQEALAKRSNVSRATISALENGKLKVTTTETLLKVAAALGCKVGDIFLE
jgi:transcriptional regulator with XRE-family HTH domain